MVKLNEARRVDAGGMVSTYNEVLRELVRNDPRVVYLDNDLGRPSGAYFSIRMQTPERFVDCGIQEANMVGVANGLSSAGMIPFAHGFACYIARKAADQVYLTGCFAEQNVKLIGTDPGVTAEQNGASHTGMEDMGILGCFPNITLVDPCDPVQLEFALRRAKEESGMFYIRNNRKPVAGIYERGSVFEFGKGVLLRDGEDVTILASGLMVAESLAAAEMLAAQGVSARVVDLFTWKPIDRELIARCARETGAVVTAENHNTACGLGVAVAGVLCETEPVPVEMVGVRDRFGQVGALEFQKQTYGLCAEDICQAVQRVLERKRAGKR